MQCISQIADIFFFKLVQIWLEGREEKNRRKFDCIGMCECAGGFIPKRDKTRKGHNQYQLIVVTHNSISRKDCAYLLKRLELYTNLPTEK